MADIQIDSDLANTPAVNVVVQTTDPTPPASGHAKLYVKAGGVYVLYDSGSPVPPGGVPSLTSDLLGVGSGDGLLSGLVAGATGAVPTRQADGSIAEVVPTAPAGGGDMVKIASHVVPSGGEATYTFASIPGTYASLLLVGLARGDYAGAAINPYLYFNSDTANHYTWQYVQAAGATPTSAAGGADGAVIALARIPAASATAGYSGSFEVRIPSYAQTVLHKLVTSSFTSKEASGGSGLYVGSFGGHWASTAAITSITLSTNAAGKFIEGSIFTLYGLN